MGVQSTFNDIDNNTHYLSVVKINNLY